MPVKVDKEPSSVHSYTTGATSHSVHTLTMNHLSADLSSENALEHVVLSACCFPNYCLLTPLMSPKHRKWLIGCLIGGLFDCLID